MNQFSHGWAELDAANKGHYGRGKPVELLDAEAEANIAWDRYDRAVDHYYYQEYDEEHRQIALRLEQEAIAAENKVKEIRAKLYPPKPEEPPTNETF